jgi:hypothetical protein
LTDFQTFFLLFSRFSGRGTHRAADSFRIITFKNETFEKKNPKISFLVNEILPILATIYEVKITFWKKLVEGAPMTYFQIDIFW